MPGPDHPIDGADRPGLLQSLSLPSSDTPYHRLRRASQHIISGIYLKYDLSPFLQEMTCITCITYYLIGGPLLKQQQVQKQNQRSLHQSTDDSFSVMYCTLFIFLLGCFVLGRVLCLVLETHL